MKDLMLRVWTFGLLGVNRVHRFVLLCLKFDFFGVDGFYWSAMVVEYFNGWEVLE